MEKKKDISKVTNKRKKNATKKTTKKAITKKIPVKSKKKKKKGFTLIELLAVIIILGILMIIAIPSVSKYISDSRKSAYVDTAKEIVGGTRNLVNSGKLGMYDTNTTYYIPSSCIQTENASKSPYGEFTQAYVGVVYDGNGYKYYWISVDDTGQGVKNITPIETLEANNIESDLTSEEIENTIKTTGVGERTNILVLQCGGTWNDPFVAEEFISEEGTFNPICKPATTLHTSVCNLDRYGCRRKFSKGSTITYGTLVEGSPKAGDAYDCDVNNDGTYDSETERFYYITEYGDKSTLIYYMNMGDQATYAYDSAIENWHGPRTGYQVLPSKSTWKHPALIKPGTREIVAHNGKNYTEHGGTIESFSYNDKVARLLSAEDILKACGVTIGRYQNNELGNCIWLLENIGQFDGDAGDSSFGYWLENPNGLVGYAVCNLDGSAISVGLGASGGSNNFTGIRPVITVKTSNIAE